MGYEKANALDFRTRKPAHRRAVFGKIVVAEHGGCRRKRLQLTKDGRIADIARMDDMVAISQLDEGTLVQTPMRI